MPKGDYVLDLLKAFEKNDYEAFKKIAKRIIEDEKQKSHNRLANSMEKIVNSFSSKNMLNDGFCHDNNNYFFNIPHGENSDSSLLSIITPKYNLNDVILSDENEAVLNRILHEYTAADKLKKYNLDAKRRLLFCGPPGCGKTMTAQAVANEINLPLLYIHMDSLISSYLGETATNLRKVFKFASQNKWVIFFDEFDTIAKNRDDKNEHGELKRSVNAFLQMLDNFKIKTLMIAATNHQHLLDNAIWRRFDEILLFDKPDKDKICKLIKNKLKVFEKDLDYEMLAKELLGMSYAQIERVCQEAMRYCILNDISVLKNNIFLDSITEEVRRKDIYKSLN